MDRPTRDGPQSRSWLDSTVPATKNQRLATMGDDHSALVPSLVLPQSTNTTSTSGWSVSPPRIRPSPRQHKPDAAHVPVIPKPSGRIGPAGLRAQAADLLRQSRHTDIEKSLAYESAKLSGEYSERELRLLSFSAAHSSAIASPTSTSGHTESKTKSKGLLHTLNQLHNFLGQSLRVSNGNKKTRIRRLNSWEGPTASLRAKLASSSPRSLESSDRHKSIAGSPTGSWRGGCRDESSSQASQTLRRSTLIRFHVLVAHVQAGREQRAAR